MKTSHFPPLFAALLAVFFFPMTPRLAAQTTIAQWNFNGTTSTNFLNANIGTGTVSGLNGPPPGVPASTNLVNGTPVDPGTLVNGTNYNRSASPLPQLLGMNNLQGIDFRRADYRLQRGDQDCVEPDRWLPR